MQLNQYSSDVIMQSKQRISVRFNKFNCNLSVAIALILWSEKILLITLPCESFESPAIFHTKCFISRRWQIILWIVHRHSMFQQNVHFEHLHVDHVSFEQQNTKISYLLFIRFLGIVGSFVKYIFIFIQNIQFLSKVKFICIYFQR